MGLGLPRGLLLNRNKMLTDYYSFMVDLANLFGANVTKATPEMLDILRFEIELAKVRCEIPTYKTFKFHHFSSAPRFR